MSFSNPGNILKIQEHSNKLRSWKRRFSYTLFISLLLFFLLVTKNTPMEQNIIATLKVSGVIIPETDKSEEIRKIADNNNVKALIILIDSPGGLFSPSQAMSEAIKFVAQKKPVVTLIDGLGASGGYLTALGSSTIFASQGSLVGSIGVIMTNLQVTNLAKKIGVNQITISSGPYKAVPNIFTPLSKEQQDYLQSLIDESHAEFKDLVLASRTNLTKSEVAKIANGKIYSTKTALSLGLIDHIGTKYDVKSWLIKHHNLSPNIKMHSLDKEKKEFLPTIISSISNAVAIKKNLLPSQYILPHNQILTYWSPEIRF